MRNLKILLLIFILLISIPFLVYFYLFVWITSIDGYPYYYRNKLGTIYTNEATGCLDICLIPVYRKLSGVDTKSFTVLHTKKGISTPYAKDKYRVYYDAKPLQNVDTATFTLIDDTLSKDKNTYYVYGTEIRKFLKEIDPNLTLDNKHQVELIENEYNPPFFFKIQNNSHVYKVYYVLDRKIEQIN